MSVEPLSLTPVPSTPNRRRLRIAGALSQRGEVLREAEEAGGVAVMLAFLRDVILLLRDLVVDPDVPRRSKIVAGSCVAYLMSPVDLVPDGLPLVGQLDDLGVLALGVRRLLSGAGYDKIYQLWRGPDEGLALLLTLAGVEE